MQHVICYKCQRSVVPLERREKDKRGKRAWIITYCPFERCGANIDIFLATPIKLWDGSYFKDELDDTTPTPD